MNGLRKVFDDLQILNALIIIEYSDTRATAREGFT